ncbi:MAG: transglycosylase domain-containing protein [Chloroflexota bacterium]
MPDARQTSLSRRQRRRRNGSGHRPSSGKRAVAGIAIAIPLFLFGSLLVAGAVGFAGVVTAFSYYSQDLPEPTEVFGDLRFDEETRVYDRSGKVLLATFARERRDVVTFDEIPPVVVDATTSIEDKTFWENAGFDPSGIVSAAVDTISGNARGASTITQQLVRNRLLPESAFTSTYERKIREIIQSIRLTQAFPGEEGKKKIIAAYLNDNFFGNNSYGIAAAARGYGGVSLDKLTLAQAAILAAMVQAPSTYDLIRNAVDEELPDGTTQLVVPAHSAIVQRRNWILELMKTRSVLTVGDYTTADYDRAIEEPVVLTPPASRRIQAPQFVLQARSQLGGILCGPDAADNCPSVDSGGFTVITTLDWKLQRMAEKWTEAGARAPNAKDTAAYLKTLGIPYQTWIKNMRGTGVHNGALAAVDYRTGQVYAYAGSAGFYLKGNEKFDPQFDVLEDGWRQPGSAFKPVNYVIGLEDRTLTASTLFMDVVTDFGGGWTPVDADRQERGPLRLRQAIQVSLNIPAIKAAVRIGPDRVFERSKDFGIRFQSAANPGGASIAIGTVVLHMIDLISAYGAIANGGVLVPRTMILEVRNAGGEKIWPLEGATTAGKRVVSAQAAFIMTDILASNTDPTQNPFWSKRAIVDGGKRRPAALKTGTTDATIDLAAVGFLAPPTDPKAPAFVVGAWMGNSDNSAPPRGVVALESAASLWQSFLTQASKGTPIAAFRRPPGLVQVSVDAYSGMRPGPFTTKQVKEWFIEDTVPTQVDNTKVGVEVDSATGDLWQEGCAGPKEVRGFLSLGAVESEFASWGKYNRGWLARAARGSGVSGGPERTRTTYFYGSGWYPFGRTWGAPFAPTKKCEIPAPSPTPIPSDSPGPSDSLPPAETPPPSPTPGPGNGGKPPTP